MAAPRHAIAWAAALILACRGSSAPPLEPGAGSVVTPQQAGGDTAWLRAGLDPGASAVAVAPMIGGKVAVAVAGGAGGAPSAALVAVDAAGELAWSAPLTSTCAPGAVPLGPSGDGALAVAVTTPCGAPVTGLAPDPVASGTVVLVAPGDGRWSRSLGPAGDLAGGGIVQAVATPAGGVVVLSAGPRPVVAALGDAGVERWRWELDGARRIAPAPSDDVVVSVGDGPAQLLRIAADGSTARWARDLPQGFAPQRLAVLTDGAVATLGSAAGRIEWGRGSAGASGVSQVVLIVVEPDGSPRTVAAVADAPAGRVPLVLAPLPHGRVLLSGFERCDRLRALSPQAEPVWERTVDPGCGAQVRAATTNGAGQLVVAGSFQGRADFGSGHVAELGPGVDAPFVLAVWP